MVLFPLLKVYTAVHLAQKDELSKPARFRHIKLKQLQCERWHLKHVHLKPSNALQLHTRCPVRVWWSSVKTTPQYCVAEVQRQISLNSRFLKNRHIYKTFLLFWQVENISGENDVKMKHHVITSTCVQDDYRSRLKALISDHQTRWFKSVGGKLGTVWISLYKECRKVHDLVQISSFPVRCKNDETCLTSHWTIVYVDGSVVSGRNDLRTGAVVLHAPYL